MPGQPILEIQNLKKTYGSVVAVEDLSLEVYPGEIFGVVGPNGAGKTTMIECAVGLREPNGGQVRVLGLDPRREGVALRARIGVQLQQAALPADIKVWEALDLYASFYSHPADWQNLLKTWGLDDKKNASFRSLSGGQKQRLFIALALVNDPQMVFLDELTTGLDPQARRNTWDLIAQLRESGKTVVLVTHFMEEAQRLCDRLAIIDRGRIVAQGTPTELIKSLGADKRVRFTTLNGHDYTWLQRLEGVRTVDRVGHDVMVQGTGNLLVEVAAALGEMGLQAEDLRVEQPSLEDVFLNLTGRAYRD
ncbi:MAG TPA: ABC transporter ATP-binding protein [Anaerolineales bacterium]|nr:ABC transporter ATP-binding protein [Anaerolineales bacterium]